MNKANKISEAELAVMKILWDADQPVSTNTIYKQLQDQWDGIAPLSAH